ncbi:MAG: Glyoxalase superfamily enzyme [Bacteroidetes bacterium]|nr:Glyoxalase superfamily enzyme [Bacteroidota bacterium]
MQKITPFLWFDGNAEEAINFYTSVFKDSSVGHLNYLPGPDSGQNGKMMTGTFKLHGQEFMVLNGGPHFKFNEAVSFFVNCENQQEVDYYWDKLTEGGTPSQCGWLKDKFGLWWQIIPSCLGALLSQEDPEKSKRAMNAMLKMKKLIIEDLKNA